MGAWDGLRYFIDALPEPPYNYLLNSLIDIEGTSDNRGYTVFVV